MEKDKYLLNSVNNALSLLDLLSHHRQLSLADISRLSGLDKSVAFRTMYTLEKNGYVDKSEDAQYCLGMKFLYYGNLVATRQDILSVARPMLQQLSINCKLAAHLGSLSGERVVTICKEESPYDIQVTARVGMNAPAYATAQGRAILAYLPELVLDDLISRFQFKTYSPRSITTVDQLKKLLAEVRRTGYAEDIDDRFPGFGSIACPIFDHTGMVTAAVGVVGLTQDIQSRQDGYLVELMYTAQTISALLGYKAEKP